MENSQPVQNRPAGIIVIALLTLLTSINFFFSAIAIIVMKPLWSELLPEDLYWIAYLCVAACIIFGLLFLYLTYGLWVGKSWGRTSHIWYYSLAIPLALSLIIFDDAMQNLGGFALIAISIAACAMVIYYLKKPEIIFLFDKSNNYKFR